MALVRQRITFPRLPAQGTPDRIWFQDFLRELEAALRVGPAHDLITFEMIQTEVPVVGVQDSANIAFTVPFEIAINPNGMPLAQLRIGVILQPYSPTDPPPSGTWHLRTTKTGTHTVQTVLIGSAPGPTDDVAFTWLYST